MANQRTRVEFRQYELRSITVTENELGRGSYAVVLEIIYRGLKCAGKKLHRVLYETGMGHAAQRYLEECRLLSQTRHPNIVQFLGVCFEEGSQFPILVMEFLPTNLTSCLDRYGTLPDEISYSILHDVSLGLAYLHGQAPPIIHRDLSGNNVLLSTNMTAKISDLGVAKMLNLTPLQQMTETPGTQAYMPPEVMVANPHYNVSLDEFSFGALMIHVFTAEWPAPKLGPTRVDPSNPHAVIAVTEVERREDLFRKIGPDHPLVDLIRRCLSNNPSFRPHTPEIVQRMSDLVSRFPPSFENRIEMLHRISANEMEKRQLQQEVDRKAAEVDQKEEKITTMNRENENQQQEHEDEIERITLAHSTEVAQLHIKLAEMQNEIRSLNTELVQGKHLHDHKKAEMAALQSQIAACKASIKSKEASIGSREREIQSLRSQMSDKDIEINSLTEAMTGATCEIASLETTLSSTRAALSNKDSTIASLNDQLTITRNYLASKLQPLQTTISFSTCADPPVAMTMGQFVCIGDVLYYGGGYTKENHKQELSNIHCYTISKNVWFTLPPHPYVWFGLGKINGKLVTMGGMYGIHIHSSMYEYDHGRWINTEKPMRTARYRPTVISHPTCLIVMAGITKSDFTNIVEIFEFSSSQWNTAASLPSKCGGLSGGIFKEKVYLFGGRNTEERLNHMLIISLDELQRSQTQLISKSWKYGNDTPAFKTSALVSTMILTLGGNVSTAFLNTENVAEIHAYSVTQERWFRIGQLPTPLSGATAAPISPTEFLVIGGRCMKGNYKKTMYKGTINVVY